MISNSESRNPVVTKDGTRLDIRAWGRGAPIVFVAGWGLPAEAWSHVVVDLGARGLRSIRYDRRSHGRSEDPGFGYDFDTLADDLASVIDAFDVRGATLVGHSMGCAEIARYLSRHGSGRVSGVVFVAPSTPLVIARPDNPDGMPPELAAKARKAIAADLPRWIVETEGGFFAEETSPEMRAWMRGLMLQTSLPALLECHRTMVEADLREDLRRMRVPTLVIQGERDATAPLAARTAALVPGARLEVYSGARHGLFLSHHERLANDVFAFATTGAPGQGRD